MDNSTMSNTELLSMYLSMHVPAADVAGTDVVQLGVLRDLMAHL